MKSNVIKALGEQLNKQVDHSDQASAVAGEGYKFSVEIQTLDGNNNGNNCNFEQFDTWNYWVALFRIFNMVN